MFYLGWAVPQLISLMHSASCSILYKWLMFRPVGLDQSQRCYAEFVHTVIREIFVVKNFLCSSKSTKIEHAKYFQRMYYVIEHELNYRRVRKVFNTNILHTNIS